MKVVVLLPLIAVASLAVLLMIKSRSQEFEEVGKRAGFHSIKLRVSTGVLSEYTKDHEGVQIQLGKVQKLEPELGAKVKGLQEEQKTLNLKMQMCKATQTSNIEKLNVLTKEHDDLKVANAKEKSSWEQPLSSLKGELGREATVCRYIKTVNVPESVRTLCATRVTEVEKEETAKAAEEAKKQEQAKAEEARKQEEAKAEEAKKQEQAKAEEAKKQEEAKAEEAKKQEQAKAEEAKKQEQAKAEEAKKQEQAKAEEAKKPEQAKAEEPKQQDQPKAEPPK